MDHADLAHRLSTLLSLTETPVAVSFDADPVGAAPLEQQPAGCCFWEPAQQQRLDTVADDHANCSVGSYTHGLIPLEKAAAGEDTAALVGSGWVGEADLIAAPALPFTPSSITYQPLAEASAADVVLVRLSSTALMTLMGAVPDISLAGKPQCMIVPLAHAGQVSVSPGCAVSRTRTRLPDDALNCAIPASELGSVIERLEASTAADRLVSTFAADDMARNFAPV
jgi:Uncharacterized protein conserved in archaea